jgi:hypothetical protein
MKLDCFPLTCRTCQCTLNVEGFHTCNIREMADDGIKNRGVELDHVTRIIRNNETRYDHVKFKQVVEPWAQRVAIRV